MTHDFPIAGAPLPLTVCMIVRNEADKLAAALASVRGVAAEIVVVDTGSADATVAIAEAHGARVLHFAWEDDFARARNVALAAASCDWILSLDADQRLPAASIGALARAVSRQGCVAQVVTIEMQHAAADAQTTAAAAAPPEVSVYSALRLMRRDPRIRYAGRVHEDVADALLAIGSDGWPDSGVTLFDGGYVDPADRLRKRERNLKLLRLSRHEAPDSLYIAYKLAITLPAAGEDLERRLLLEAVLHRARGLSARELGGLPFMPRLIAIAASDLADQGRLMDSLAALCELQPRMDRVLDFTLGVALARAGLMDAARERLAAFVRDSGGTRDPIVLLDEAAHPAEACRWLAWLERTQGSQGSPVAASGRLRQARAFAGPAQLVGIECEAIELQLAAGDVQGAAGALDRVAALVAQQPGGLPRLMLVSARLAQATGDAPAALELAQAAVVAEDDDAAVLLATLEIQAGPVDAARLRHHHDAIAGRRFDTLAVKRLIGDSLGLAWPHELPDATRACLRGLRGE